MAENEEVQRNEKVLNELIKDHVATQAIKKLNRKPLEVSVYRHSSLIESLESELDAINNEIGKTSDAADKQLQNQKELIERQLKAIEIDKIEGVLTPLTYRDIGDIKAAITEAVMHFNEYNLDTEVKIARVMAEERYMTVFCALKQKENVKSRYFKTLDEIAMCDDVTILDLYNKWEKHFVLTEDELKN